MARPILTLKRKPVSPTALETSKTSTPQPITNKKAVGTPAVPEKEKGPAVTPKGTKPKLSPEQEALEQTERAEKQRRLTLAMTSLVAMSLPMPIALGSGKTLMARLRAEGHGTVASRTAIQKWVSSVEYFEKTLSESHRFNIDGSQATAITDKERTYARKKLARQNR